MLDFDEVEKSYHNETLFEKASFTIGKREKCALVGRNGTGKTTLFRMITKEEEPDEGRVSYPKGYTFGYLKQHLKFTKEILIDEAVLGLRPDEQDEQYKVEAILFGLGFKEEDLYRPLSDFSGGYHLRVHLAKVLVSRPDCLLLDEPTNFLDIIAIRFLTKFLQDWDQEMLVISHDREFLDAISTHTLGIYRKKIHKVRGGTEKLYSLILEDEERHEKMRINLEKKRAHAEAFVKRFGAKASKATQAESRKKMIAKMPVLDKLAELYSLSFNFTEAPFPGVKMAQADHLNFSYTDEPLINDVNLAIEKGERIAIIGKNGQGKSTLLRLLAKDLQPTSGTVTYSENTRLGYFGQSNIDRLHASHTIEEEISQANPKLNLTQVRAICGIMCFSQDLAEKKISFLSGGERSRVLLGKILATPCNLLLLDEPTNHLDIESIEALLEAIDEFEGSVIMVTHSELILDRIPFTKLIICRANNQEVFLGSYEEFLAKKGWAEEESSESPKKNTSYQDEKKKKSEEKLKEGQVKRQIEAIENQLLELESQITKESEELIQATALKQSQRIVALSKSIAAKQDKYNSLFSELESFQ